MSILGRCETCGFYVESCVTDLNVNIGYCLYFPPRFVFDHAAGVLSDDIPTTLPRSFCSKYIPREDERFNFLRGE